MSNYPPDYAALVMLVIWAAATMWAWGQTLRASFARSHSEFVAVLTGSLLAGSVVVALLLIALGTNIWFAASLPLGVAGAGGLAQRVLA